MMQTQRKTTFTVSQIAGSLRMEGIVVSPQDESVMTAIVNGQLNVAEHKKRLVEQYKKQNAVIV